MQSGWAGVARAEDCTNLPGAPASEGPVLAVPSGQTVGDCSSVKWRGAGVERGGILGESASLSVMALLRQMCFYFHFKIHFLF